MCASYLSQPCKFYFYRLIFCPAEAAKDSVEDSCKDFVYDIIRNLGDLFYYSFAFGTEELKNLRRFKYDDSTRGTHTGEK